MRSIRFGRALIAILIILIAPDFAFAQKALIIFGLDDTGSYHLQNKGREAGSAVIRDLKSGDVFYARRITDKSYEDACSIFRLNIPQTGSAPENKFDRRAYLEWEKRVKHADMLRNQAIGILSRLTPVKSQRTDIWGFLAAAALRFKAENTDEFARKVIIASDMKDNVSKRILVDLMGAEVVVVAFESGDNPAASSKLQAYWTQNLKACKAQRVIFLPPDSKYALNRP